MKFYQKVISIAFLVFASLLCCCSYITNEEESDEYGHVRIFIGGAENKRTLLPVMDNQDIESIYLLGRTSLDEEYEEIGNWESVSDIPELSLLVGNWDLKAIVHTEHCSFSDTKNIEITNGSHLNLNFSLVSELEAGGMYLKLNLNGSAAAADYNFTDYDTGDVIDTGALDIQGTGSAHYVEYARRIQYPSEALSEGNYYIEITFYGDEDRQLLLNTYEEAVLIKNGYTSKGERSIDLNGVYTIEYDLNGGSVASGVTLKTLYTPRTADYTIPTLTKTGYNFAGWFESSDFSGSQVTVLAQGTNANKHFYAKWSTRTDTAYTVKHMFQTVASATAGTQLYEENVNERQSLTGTTDSTTAAEAGSYTGFDAQPITQETITADGSTVVEVKYNRHVYNVTYNRGIAPYSTVPSPSTAPYGASVLIRFTDYGTYNGYLFNGWKIGDTLYTHSGSTFTMPAEDVTIVADWVPDPNTGYTVKHWQQNVTLTGNDANDYVEVVADRQELSGTTGENTNAVAKTSYTGFTAKTFTQKAISADGQTVVNIYYDRNPYTVTFAPRDDDNAIVLPSELTKRYGETVNLLTTFDTNVTSRTGYTFDGWAIGSASNPTYTSSGESSFVITGNTTLTACWTPAGGVPYTVKHWQQNIEDDEYTLFYTDTSKTGVSNQNTNAIANTYDGFTALTFSQQSIDSHGTTVVNIYYNRNLHSVVYDDNTSNETISVPSTLNNIRYGATVNINYTIDSRTAYEFDGWQNGSTDYLNDGSSPTFIMPDEDVTLSAKWTPITYTVTLVANGGVYSDSYTGPTSDFTKNPNNLTATFTYNIEDTRLFLPTNENSFSKTGYNLRFWYEEPDFSDTSHTWIEHGSYGDKTFYAKWTPVEYSIHYVINEGGFDVNYNGTNTYTIESGEITLPVEGEVRRQGYNFEGWYTKDPYTTDPSDPVQPVRVYTQAANLTGTQTYYAKWSPADITITYENLKTATNPASNLTTVTPETPEFTLADPSLLGYTFEGWYLSINQYTGVGVGNKYQTISNLIFPLTLYATWKTIRYTINYELDGGTNSWYNDRNSYTIESTDYSLSDPTKANYTFEGWYTDSSFNASSRITEIPAGSTGDITLYAHFVPTDYTITYVLLRESEVTTPSPTTYNVETDSFYLEYPTKPGYYFSGWFDGIDEDEEFDGEEREEIAKGSTGDLTLYGEFYLASYSISYKNLKSVTNPSANLRTITMETETFTLENLTKNYYTFNGWFDNKDEFGNGTGNQITEITKGQTGPITLYASWTPIEYTITLNTNGGSYVSGYRPPATYTKEDDLIKLPTALQITKDGYMFAGWYQSSNFTNNCYSYANTVSYDTNVTYYAKWVNGLTTNGQQAYTQIQNASANENVALTGELSEADLIYIGTALKNKSESIKLDLSETTITSLPQDAFTGSNISRLSLPASITDIKSGALKDCTNLNTVIYAGTKEQWKDIHFGHGTSNGWRDNISATQVTCSDGSMNFAFFEIKPQSYAEASDPSMGSYNCTTLVSGTGTVDDPFILPADLYVIQIGYRSDADECYMYPLDSGYFSYGSGPSGSWKLWLNNTKSYEEKTIRLSISGDFSLLVYIKVLAR